MRTTTILCSITFLSFFYTILCASSTQAPEQTTVDSVTESGSTQDPGLTQSSSDSPQTNDDVVSMSTGATTDTKVSSSQLLTSDDGVNTATSSPSSSSSSSSSSSAAAASAAAAAPAVGIVSTDAPTQSATTNKDATSTAQPAVEASSADSVTPSTGSENATAGIVEPTLEEVTCPEYNTTYEGDDLIVEMVPEKCEMVVSTENLEETFRGLGRLFGRKIKKNNKQFQFPAVMFRAINQTEGSIVQDTDCELPTRKIGPFIVIDTVPDQCQLIIGISRPKRKGGKKNKGKKGKRVPVLQYLREVLLE